MISRVPIIIVVTLLSLIPRVNAEVIRLSEPSSYDQDSETFGAESDTAVAITSIADLKTSPAAFAGQLIRVDAKVAKVCQKKGCFLIAHQGADSLRVTFKDYGFFVPTDIAGRQVILIGELVSRDLSPKQADHFSKDLGEQGSVTAGQVVEIVASSVRVTR